MVDVSPICGKCNSQMDISNPYNDGRWLVVCPNCNKKFSIRDYICSCCYKPMYILEYMNCTITFCSNPECELYTVYEEVSIFRDDNLDITRTFEFRYDDNSLLVAGSKFDDRTMLCISNRMKINKEFRVNLVNALMDKYNLKAAESFYKELND